jgi:omega-6 fatty acid desaturase (delta-12 desaturase)
MTDAAAPAENTDRTTANDRLGVPQTWLRPDEWREFTTKSNGTAALILAMYFFFYFATLYGALAPLPIWLNVLFALFNGAIIGAIFVIGHDAVHSAFVQSRKSNRWIARVTFVPCAHAPSLWETVHNKRHHNFTNLKPEDYVWAPLSKAEFDALARWRQWVERVYRGPLGPAVYYYFAFWLPKLIVPIAPEMRVEWRKHVFDSAFLIAAQAALIVTILMVGKWLGPERPYWLIFVLGWAAPYAMWSYLIALIVYLQHTHPRIAWFNDREQWSFYRGNILGTVHIILPFPYFRLSKQVMEHHAHHALPSIPVYNLPRAQARIKEVFGEDALTITLTPKTYFGICSVCKLFDFEKLQWTDFRGRPTADPIRLSR